MNKLVTLYVRDNNASDMFARLHMRYCTCYVKSDWSRNQFWKHAVFV